MGFKQKVVIMIKHTDLNTKQLHLHFSSRVVADVLAEIVSSHRENQRISTGLQQTNQNLQQFVVSLIQPGGILSPELFTGVHRRPLEAAGANLRGVLVKGGQVLHRGLQLLKEKLNVLLDVGVVKLLARLLENFQVLQHLALHHCDSVFSRNVGLIFKGLLNQVLKAKQNQLEMFLMFERVVIKKLALR